MALGLELDYRLRWMDFDRYGRIQPAALLDIFQDVATVQAIDMGIGRDDLLPQGVFWAVVRSKFEIVKAPSHYQVVTVRTWPHTPTRFSFLRDFAMRDGAGDVLVKATSEWVLMDIESRKFASVKDHLDTSDDYDEARAFDRKPRKIADFEEGNRPVLTVVPSCIDIDVNGHVNNARYANYAVEALDLEEGRAIKSFQIDYRHEAMAGVPLAMHTFDEGASVRLKGINPSGDVAFACAIELV